MPIRAHLAEHTVFEPEAIQAMSTAFELACADLQICAGDERGREIIAARIIDLARNGGFDASTLHQRVIAEAHLSMQPPQLAASCILDWPPLKGLHLPDQWSPIGSWSGPF